MRIGLFIISGLLLCILTSFFRCKLRLNIVALGAILALMGVKIHKKIMHKIINRARGSDNSNDKKWILTA